MLIWDFWPHHEGGSERQSRLVASRLAARGVSCEVVTSWPSFALLRTQNDGQVVVRRLGSLCPFAVAGRKVFGWFERILRRTMNISSPAQLVAYERSLRVIEFWAMLPLVWLARLSFIVELMASFAARKPGYDVVHLHEPSWLGGVAVCLGKKHGFETICQEATSPALPVVGYDVPFRGLWGRLRMRAHYIAMAQYTMDDLVVNGIPKQKISLVPNGVVVPHGLADCSAQSDVLYVGNFSQGSEWKGFDVLVQAWAIVHKRKPEARITLVGGGDCSVWEDLAVREGCRDSMTFAGRTPTPEAYYASSGVFVLPSRVEGMSNALLEAQSWGLPAVISDIEGNMAIVENEVNGLVSVTGSPLSLADAIIRLLSDDSLRVRFGVAARKRIEKDFSIDVVVERLIAVYRQFCPGRRPEFTR